ncbi:MAG: flavodoxin-dependent (E)-4-hydroxy-3-methylbut-2-enyl-diphosphate synthase [Candidatus Krumholzibacteria bacterium]|nr:flavodoxin-dependent (E)-4-hydroxy-3-methylbut-2-enyl-diphosphate synthase [Candidatus Krumholzibacteria bacterium]
MKNVKRRKTRAVRYGDVGVGGGFPITIQSMTTARTADARAVMREIRALARAGCELVRVAVKDRADVEALSAVCARSPIPVIADVHFDYRLAVASAAAGAAGLRINPGNIGGADKVRRVVDAAAAAAIPIRIGVNSGSIERDLRSLARIDPAGALCESAARSRDLVERMGFRELVFSLKSPDAMVTVEANRAFAAGNDYPLHIGVTEAGPPLSGAAKSAVALALLLREGIGDTVRVSLSGDPVREVTVAAAVLSALGLRADITRIVSCPTCGRSHIDVSKIAARLERDIIGLHMGGTVAVMGCEVNGPGEAKDADIGLAGSCGGAILFEKGRVVRSLKGNIAEEFIFEVRDFLRNRGD